MFCGSQSESADEAAKAVSPQPKKGKTEEGAVAEEKAEATKDDEGVEKMEEDKKEEETKEGEEKEEKKDEDEEKKAPRNTPQQNFFR